MGAARRHEVMFRHIREHSPAESTRPGTEAAGPCIARRRQNEHHRRCEVPRGCVPLVVIAGKEYGSGSSRDWAAKGTRLLGARAVVAESYERIHRSNLIGMGVLPLEFQRSETRESLGLTGHEVFSIEGVVSLAPGSAITVRAKSPDGKEKRFTVTARVDTPEEVSYYKHGGILQYVLRQML